jgi:site-specific recombinase XerD
MFNRAVEWDYLRDNPFNKIKLQTRQKQNPVYVTEEQLSEILKYINIDIVRDVALVAFYTGLRLGEIVNLCCQDVNLKEGLLIIGNSYFRTKSRRQRIVPIPTRVREILTKRFPKIIRKENHYVFCKSNRYPYTGDFFSKKFKKAVRAAGMDERVHFHTLRHSFASSLVQKGVPLYSIKELLGHSSISCTEIYSHLNLNSLRDAISKLN